ALEVVVRIIERVTVVLEFLRAEDRVQEDLFHAVAVATVAGDAQQVAGELEVCVAPARRFKTAVGGSERGVEVITVRFTEILLGTPAARGEALGGNHREPIARGIEMHPATGRD